MLVSSTEPRPFHSLGKLTTYPERFGCDFLFVARGIRYGVQRKEMQDFISSATDRAGDRRLGVQVDQMQALGPGRAMLVLEGQPKWTLDGQYIGNGYGQKWSRASHLGLLWSIRQRGIWVEQSANMGDTVEVIKLWEAWAKKAEHRSLEQRPGPVGNSYGKVGNRDWERHVVQGIMPGIGPKLADVLIDEFGMPIRWKDEVTPERLVAIPGVGKKTAEKLLMSLR